jgi:hypothetical protein
MKSRLHLNISSHIRQYCLSMAVDNTVDLRKSLVDLAVDESF